MTLSCESIVPDLDTPTLATPLSVLWKNVHVHSKMNCVLAAHLSKFPFDHALLVDCNHHDIGLSVDDPF